MNKKLTKLQGFNAITKLFQIYYDLDPSGDIGGILGSMAFLRDRRTTDESILEFWTECLDVILKHKNLRDYNHLTPLQVFLAAGDFLEGFYGITDISWEIKFIQQNVRLARDKKLVDPTLWKNWLQCVDEVLAVKDSRTYFRLRRRD
jgi:hypothetical protein